MNKRKLVFIAVVLAVIGLVVVLQPWKAWQTKGPAQGQTINSRISALERRMDTHTERLKDLEGPHDCKVRTVQGKHVYECKPYAPAAAKQPPPNSTPALPAASVSADTAARELARLRALLNRRLNSRSFDCRMADVAKDSDGMLHIKDCVPYIRGRGSAQKAPSASRPNPTKAAD